MKRHPALEPFSRDHNDGLILARILIENREGAAERMKQEWDRELQDHFAEEERLLGPLATPADQQRLREEHQDLEDRINALPEGVVELGEKLDAHIRWEEREFFPAVEANATEEQLAELMKLSSEVEMRRWPHDARRADLVQKRWKL